MPGIKRVEIEKHDFNLPSLESAQNPVKHGPQLGGWSALYGGYILVHLLLLR